MIYLIGAGPGDPELLTLKAKRAIEEADVILHAGSLINPEILKYAKEGAKLYNSAGMTLEEIFKIILKAAREKKAIARLHSGDPSIYGAMQEEIEFFERKKLRYEIIPGVSSFVAAAASLRKEYTIPEVSQTLIITRMEGRTGVPEKLRELAKHRCSMCIFLSAGMIDKVVKELRNGYLDETPAAVVYRASWKDEKIIRGKLKSIAGKVEKERINKTALMLVGDFLRAKGKRSKLYDGKFGHSFRGRK